MGSICMGGEWLVLHCETLLSQFTFPCPAHAALTPMSLETLALRILSQIVHGAEGKQDLAPGVVGAAEGNDLDLCGLTPGCHPVACDLRAGDLWHRLGLNRTDNDFGC